MPDDEVQTYVKYKKEGASGNRYLVNMDDETPEEAVPEDRVQDGSNYETRKKAATNDKGQTHLSCLTPKEAALNVNFQIYIYYETPKGKLPQSIMSIGVKIVDVNVLENKQST